MSRYCRPDAIMTKRLKLTRVLRVLYYMYYTYVHEKKKIIIKITETVYRTNKITNENPSKSVRRSIYYSQDVQFTYLYRYSVFLHNTRWCAVGLMALFFSISRPRWRRAFWWIALVSGKWIVLFLWTIFSDRVRVLTIYGVVAVTLCVQSRKSKKG